MYGKNLKFNNIKLIITLFLLFNKVIGENSDLFKSEQCSEITIYHKFGERCSKYCESQEKDPICIQWRCNNLKETIKNFNFANDNFKQDILNSKDCKFQSDSHNNKSQLIPRAVNNTDENNNPTVSTSTAVQIIPTEKPSPETVVNSLETENASINNISNEDNSPLTTNSLITSDPLGNIIELNLGGKLQNGIINESICELKYLKTLDISNNNLKGNNTFYGQLPGCLYKLNRLETILINNNKFRGRIPLINENIKKCDIRSNDHLCLFHGDSIPKICLDKNVKSLNNKDEYKNAQGVVYFILCKNIFVDRNQTVTSRIFNNIENTNINSSILIYSGIFPVCSLIITTAITIYGRVKSKFNKKDNNISRISASISHLPNNFGNISSNNNNNNNNNRQSLLTKFDSFNHPAPRVDNENSFNSKSNSISTVDQKRISSNPSYSFANTSLSSNNTPTSPVISPNEIKNSNYRVIGGSHYSLSMNPAQAVHFKNTLSTLQNSNKNINNNNTNPADISSSSIGSQKEEPKVMNKPSVPHINTANLPVSSQSLSDNHIFSPTNRNNGNISAKSAPSKAKESLDQLLSSPEALYYQNNRNDYRRGMMSPTKNKLKSPIQINKFATSSKISTSPEYSLPPYIASSKIMSPESPNSPSYFKSNSPVENHTHKPNTMKKPRIRRVVYSFIADLPDELPLTPGQEVIIHKAFDDGYAYGENAANGQLGVFPITSLHPDDQDITPEEIESSPSLNDLQLSQLSINNNKSPAMMSPSMMSPTMMSPSMMSPSMLSPTLMSPTVKAPTLVNPKSSSKFNNMKINKENGNTKIPQELYTNKNMSINNLYLINNNSQNSYSQNSNSQNSLTDEDDIDYLRKQSKIGYSAFMDQQKQKLMKKQAKQQAKINKINALNEERYRNSNNINSNNNDNSFHEQSSNSYNESYSQIYVPHNAILNENNNNSINNNNNNNNNNITNNKNRIYNDSRPSQFAHSTQLPYDDMDDQPTRPPYSQKYKNMTNILNSVKSESPSALEMQRMEDRRNKQIKLLNESLNKKDIGPEEKRYYLQLLQQLTN